MNDDFQLTDEQLRLATSRSLPAGAQLDAETSAARESFLAIGRSVESAAGEHDEAALISRLSLSREQTCSRSAASRNWWPLVLCGALAASALIAIARIATMATPGDVAIVKDIDSNSSAAVAYNQPFESRTVVGWNDPLDDEIALAAATIQQYGDRTRDFDGSLREMNLRLDELSHELLSDSLNSITPSGGYRMRALIRLTIVLVAILALGLAAQAQPPSPENPDQKSPSTFPKGRGGFRGDARPEPRAEARPGDDPPRLDPPPQSGGRGRQGAPDKGGPEAGPRGFGKMPDGGGRGGGFGGSYGGGGYGGGGFTPAPGARGGYGEYPRLVPPGGMPGGMGFYGPGGEGPPDDPEMRELMKQDADLDRQTHEMAARIREARGEDRNKIKSQITELANKHFDIRQKRRELQLKRMEEELGRLREAIAKRNTARDSIVENHIRELVGEPRDLDF